MLRLACGYGSMLGADFFTTCWGGHLLKSVPAECTSHCGRAFFTKWGDRPNLDSHETGTDLSFLTPFFCKVCPQFLRSPVWCGRRRVFLCTAHRGLNSSRKAGHWFVQVRAENTDTHVIIYFHEPARARAERLASCERRLTDCTLLK